MFVTVSELDADADHKERSKDHYDAGMVMTVITYYCGLAENADKWARREKIDDPSLLNNIAFG